MEKKSIRLPAALVAAVLLGLVACGCAARTSPTGEDLSKPAVPPANMGQNYQQHAKPH